MAVLKTCACTNEIRGSQETKKREPVSSTSRRGAKAAYHDEYPRDFGPRIACTVSEVSDTSRPPIRQGGREMSAPRPYETYPFHPPALFTPYKKINFYIYTKLLQLFLPYGVYALSWNIVHLSFTNALFQVQQNFKSFCPPCGTYWYEIRRDTPLKLGTDASQCDVGAVNVRILQVYERKRC